MQDPLSACINNFGPAPREFSWWDRVTYLRVPKPTWLRVHPNDRLMTLFRNLNRLFCEGTVVWGHIVQANSLMFESGSMNCPGELVYSIESQGVVNPEYLAHVAHQLYSLKGTEPTQPDLMPIAEYLTDEMIRVFGLQVPPSISPEIPCRISTTFFVRKHLPQRRICQSIMPVIVHPAEPYVALPLPEGYWPEELRQWWMESA